MSASSSVFGKLYNQKEKDATDAGALYNFLQLSTVFLGWGVLFLINFSFEPTVLLYSLLFALSYTVCNIGIIYALKYGPAVLTSLFVGLALIVTTVWGFFFWDATPNLLVIIGLILVVIAIYLCLGVDKKEERTFSWKWLFFALFALAGNAGCSIVQRTQQVQFEGAHGNMLMFFATGISALSCLVIYLRSNKKDTVSIIKKAGWIPVAAGLCNLVLNLFVMLMATSTLSPSLIYPSIAVGGLMIVTLFSLFCFKDKLTKKQWVGIAIGAIAVGLLSL
jgi:drug/metabolite transporter (DMT)-like permease